MEVVRDVYRGVALIDGPDGTIEVSKGDMIPGAGTVAIGVLLTAQGMHVVVVAPLRQPTEVVVPPSETDAIFLTADAGVRLPVSESSLSFV